jgi:hypothetical protein
MVLFGSALSSLERNFIFYSSSTFAVWMHGVRIFDISSYSHVIFSPTSGALDFTDTHRLNNPTATNETGRCYIGAKGNK